MVDLPVWLPMKLSEAIEFYRDAVAEPDTTEGAMQVQRLLARGDLFYLMTHVLGRRDIIHPWLFDRCREVQKDPDGRLDLWARAHYKSSIITYGHVIMEVLRDPDVTIGIFSHTRPIAKSFLRQIKREFEANEKLRGLFPDIFWDKPTDAPQWSEDGGIIVKRQSNPKEATIEAWGMVDGQPTSRHFKIMIYDDVVVPESVSTAEQIEKTTRAWEMSRNLGTEEEKGGRSRYIGTRYSLYDTYKTIMDRGAAIPRVYAATHNGRLDGRPVFFSEAEWGTRLKESSRQTLAAQMLQNPLADSDATFQTQWLRAYELRPRTMNVYIMADPSRGRSATSDNTAMAVVGVSSTGAKFLLDGACHRMTLSQRWVMLRGLYHRWSAMPGVQHVSVGYERYGQQSDDEYFQEQMELEHRRNPRGNAHFPINELAWPREGGGSKRERVERLEPDLRNGRFYLPLPVLHEGKPKTWRVLTDPASKDFGLVEYLDSTGLTKAQMDAMQGGSPDLLARALICRDPDLASPRAGGGRYDLTLLFINELQTFPFGKNDDMLDAVSRVYDMEITAPVAASARQEHVTVYTDGV